MNLNKLFAVVLALACVVPGVFAQVSTQRITLTISITNRPVTSNTLVVNSSTRTWTNASTAATIQTNLISTATSATNLYNQIENFPYSGGISPRWLTETSMALIAPLGGALAASQSGAWAVLTLSTQSGPNTFTALWPLENIAGPAVNKTNQASAFVAGLGQFGTNAFPTNATALSNVITKGASPRQHVSSPITLNGGFSGVLEKMTNGYGTNTVLDSPKTTNLVNNGNAIRSEGSGGNSFQAGSNALAQGSLAVALGNSSIAHGPSSVAFGTGATATNSDTIAIGTGATSTNSASIAIGSSALATRDSATVVGFDASGDLNAVAIGSESVASAASSVAIGAAANATAHSASAFGTGAVAAHSNSVAIGAVATTTTTNQVRLGTATETVSIPGVLAISGTQTDTIFSGTNKFQLAISYSVTNITSLANGGNDLDPGFKTYIKVSGPSAAYSIDKIDRGWDGRIIEIQKTDSLTLTIPNNSGFGVLGDSAKILTGTGGTIIITNNPGFVELKYDAGALRWGVKSKSN